MNASYFAIRLLTVLLRTIVVLIVAFVIVVFPLYALFMVVWLHAPQSEVVLFTTIAAVVVLLAAGAIEWLRRWMVRWSEARDRRV